MSHVRTQIREAAIALLADLDATVTGSRLHRWQEDELPEISVYTVEEAVETEDTDRRTQLRRLTLRLDVAFASTTGDLDADMDDLVAAIETALEADDECRFGGLAADPGALIATAIGFVGEAESRFAIARLDYQVTYWTLPGAPESHIDI